MADRGMTDETSQFIRWAKGDQNAAKLMLDLGRLSQLADDIVDGDAEHVSFDMTRVLKIALYDLPLNPFYRAFCHQLAPVCLTALLNFDASNEWAKSDNEKTRMFAFVLRESLEPVFALIALLVGGEDHAATVVREMHDYYHNKHQETFSEWEADR